VPARGVHVDPYRFTKGSGSKPNQAPSLDIRRGGNIEKTPAHVMLDLLVTLKLGHEDETAM